MDRMPQVVGEINLQEALELFHKLAEFLAHACHTGTAAHEVERKYFDRLSTSIWRNVGNRLVAAA